MDKEQLDILHYSNKVRQLQQALEYERVRNFSLRRLLCEIRFQAKPFLNKLDKIRDYKE